MIREAAALADQTVTDGQSDRTCVADPPVNDRAELSQTVTDRRASRSHSNLRQQPYHQRSLIREEGARLQQAPGGRFYGGRRWILVDTRGLLRSSDLGHTYRPAKSQGRAPGICGSPPVVADDVARITPTMLEKLRVLSPAYGPGYRRFTSGERYRNAGTYGLESLGYFYVSASTVPEGAKAGVPFVVVAASV